MGHKNWADLQHKSGASGNFDVRFITSPTRIPGRRVAIEPDGETVNIGRISLRSAFVWKRLYAWYARH